MKKEYTIKKGSIVKIDPTIAGHELERIENQYGKITPEIVLQESKNKKSPFYSHFEWDNEKAGNRWRISQAGYLIRSITVSISAAESQDPQRAFVCVSKTHLPGSDHDTGSYVSLESAMSDKDTRDLLLQKALQEIKFWKIRYANLKELSKIFCAIDSHFAK